MLVSRDISQRIAQLKSSFDANPHIIDKSQSANPSQQLTRCSCIKLTVAGMISALHRSLLNSPILRQRHAGFSSCAGSVTVPFTSKLLFNLATLGREPETREHIGTMNAQGPSRRMARMELANLAFVGTWFKGVQGVGISFAN